MSQHLVAGATSGLISAVAFQPLDLVKTRLQQQAGGIGAISVLHEIINKEGGVPALWRGTVPTVIRNVPGVALYFQILQGIRSTMRTIPFFLAHDSNQRRQLSTLPRLSPHGDLFAGAVARIAVGLVLNPVTLVKARFESNLHPRRTVAASLKHVIQTYGKRGLLLGFGASALRDAPYSGIFVLSYELIKHEAARMPYVSIPIALALSSGAAATISTVLTQPFDVAKTNMQLHPTHYSGVWQTLVLLGRERGLKGYFDGLWFRTAKKGLSSATLWAVYETSLRYLLAE